MKLLSSPIDSTDSQMELLNFKNTIYFQNMNSHELVHVSHTWTTKDLKYLLGAQTMYYRFPNV